MPARRRACVNLLYGNDGRPGAGARSARRFHHLHRLEPRRRRDQGGERPAPRRARTRRQRHHHRARRRRPGRGRAACARNSMRLAGQSCISVQNVYVHESVYDAVRRADRCARSQDARSAIRSMPATDVGTLIDEAAAQRVESWVEEAIARGRARADRRPAPRRALRADGARRRQADDEAWSARKSSGRWSPCSATRDLDAALRARSAPTRTGCSAASSPSRCEVAFDAIRALRVGGVIVNGTSTWRTDQLAYGGVKASGIGREGPRYAIARHDRGASGRVQS